MRLFAFAALMGALVASPSLAAPAYVGTWTDWNPDEDAPEHFGGVVPAEQEFCNIRLDEDFLSGDGDIDFELSNVTDLGGGVYVVQALYAVDALEPPKPFPLTLTVAGGRLTITGLFDEPWDARACVEKPQP